MSNFFLNDLYDWWKTPCFYGDSDDGKNKKKAAGNFAFLLKNFSEDREVSYKNYLHFSYILGVSESMLYRITREFIKNKIIEKGKSRIIIKDEEKLMKYYEEYMYL